MKTDQDYRRAIDDAAKALNEAARAACREAGLEVLIEVESFRHIEDRHRMAQITATVKRTI